MRFALLLALGLALAVVGVVATATPAAAACDKGAIGDVENVVDSLGGNLCLIHCDQYCPYC